MNTTKKFIECNGLAITDNKNRLIAEVSHNLSVLELSEYEANAKLIAAAPELLKALIVLKKWVGKLSDWEGADPPCEIVDKAIEKATK